MSADDAMCFGPDDPRVLDAEAFSLAAQVRRKEPVRIENVDEWANARGWTEERYLAIVVIARTHGWIEGYRPTWGNEHRRRKPSGEADTHYIVGPNFFRAERENYERIHGEGTAPREEWER